MTTKPKFVINNGQIFCAWVEFHSEICKDNTKTTGGGYWHRDAENKTIYLYGGSLEFGAATEEEIAAAYFHERDGSRGYKVVVSRKTKLEEVLKEAAEKAASINKPKHLRIVIPLEANAEHPQKTMQRLNITYQHATPQSMADQWWFWNCGNVPDPLPDGITILNLDPMAAIGHGLSKEDASKIANYKAEENK